METEMRISFTKRDCELIYIDLKPYIEQRDGLRPETYNLYNTIKGMINAYNHIEGAE